ncbi:MAG: DUF2147 domain-containing protein [Bacteroidota bacterium]
MRSFIITFSFILLGTVLSAMSSNPSQQICGQWQSEDGNSQIEIYQEAGKYFGKIIYLREPNHDSGHPKTDQANPDPQLRTRPIIGLVIISDLQFVDDKWTNGSIYFPAKGQTADCEFSLIKESQLQMEISKSFFSTTTVWTRL